MFRIGMRFPDLEPTLLDPNHVLPGGRVVARPGVWYTAHALPLGQLNAVRRSAVAEDELPALLAEVAFAHRGAASRWTLLEPRPALERLLEGAGYRSFHVVELLVAEVDALPPPREDAPRARLAREAGEVHQLAVVYGASRGQPAAPADAPWALLLAPQSRQRVVLVEEGGVALAAGALQLDPARGAGLLWGGGTRPEARQQGAYRATLDARFAEARRLGLRWLFALARQDSTAAPLRRLGFRRLRELGEWERPAATP